MLIQTSHHTITLHDDFTVIVPHPGHELTSEYFSEIKGHICPSNWRKPILFFPNSQYSIGQCAMKELIKLKQELVVAIVSGSERTQMTFSFISELCKSIEIFQNTDAAYLWFKTLKS